MPPSQSVEVLRKIGPTTVTLAYDVMTAEAARTLGLPLAFLILVHLPG